ncbi:fifo, partial [Anopheles flavivirus variant 2]
STGARGRHVCPPGPPGHSSPPNITEHAAWMDYPSRLCFTDVFYHWSALPSALLVAGYWFFSVKECIGAILACVILACFAHYWWAPSVFRFSAPADPVVLQSPISDDAAGVPIPVLVSGGDMADEDRRPDCPVDIDVFSMQSKSSSSRGNRLDWERVGSFLGKRPADSRSVVWDPHGDCLVEKEGQRVRTGPPRQHIIMQLPTRGCEGHVDCIKELAQSTRSLAELWENTYLTASGLPTNAGSCLRVPPFELGSDGRSVRLNRIPVDPPGGHADSRGSRTPESFSSRGSSGSGENSGQSRIPRRTRPIH